MDRKELLSRLDWYLRRDRKKSFARVFDIEGTLGKDVEHVLAYLRNFCFVNKTTASENTIEMAVLEGRRQVFLKIMEIMNFDLSKVEPLMEVHDELIRDD